MSWSDADLAFRDQVRAFSDAELTAEMRRDVRRIDQRLSRLEPPGEFDRARRGFYRARVASRDPAPDEMDAYERLLGDAMLGDPTLFAREDSVEEAWRVVDPVLNTDMPVYEYEPGTWGPKEVDQSVCPPGGWQNPVVDP